MKGILEKSGTWISYKGERLGQGRENARVFLKEHHDIRGKIDHELRKSLGLCREFELKSRRSQKARSRGRKAHCDGRGCRQGPSQPLATGFFAAHPKTCGLVESRPTSRCSIQNRQAWRLRPSPVFFVVTNSLSEVSYRPGASSAPDPLRQR